MSLDGIFQAVHYAIHCANCGWVRVLFEQPHGKQPVSAERISTSEVPVELPFILRRFHILQLSILLCLIAFADKGLSTYSLDRTMQICGISHGPLRTFRKRRALGTPRGEDAAVIAAYSA